MYPIGVVGPGSEHLAERLAEHLAEYGRVGVLADRRGDYRGSPDRDPTTTDGGAGLATPEGREELSRYRAAGATSAYELGTEEWHATGERNETSMRNVLYLLAPRCDFCVVEGTSGTELPTILLGNTESAGTGESEASAEREASVETVLERAMDPETVDLDAVRKRLVATEPIETLESLVERAKESARAPESGAVATFTGRVRAQENADDTPTEYLEFEKYEGVADERMGEISAELEKREGVHEVLMHHRTGRLEYGEDIVFVVVLAGHREEAFRTVEDGIDRLKAEVPIFKKEVTVDEEFWVHDRP